MGRRNRVALSLAFATGVSAAEKKAEFFGIGGGIADIAGDFGGIADIADIAGEFGGIADIGSIGPFGTFSNIGADVVGGVRDELLDRFNPFDGRRESHPPPPRYEHPTRRPTYAPTERPTVEAPEIDIDVEIAPTKPPTPLPENPCGHHVKHQEITYVDFDPTKVSPDDVCKYLTRKFLNPFFSKGEVEGKHKKKDSCKYYDPMGGYVDPYSNDGTTTAPYAPQGVTVVSKGACSNFYFNPSAYTKLTAPEVDEYGKCYHPKAALHRRLKADRTSRAHGRRLDAYGAPKHEHEALEYGMPYPVKVYKSGFDYLLQCTCACSGPIKHYDPHHSEFGYGEISYSKPSYGEKPSHGYEPTYRPYQATYGHEEPSYGYEPKGHGKNQGYGHEQPKHGYGHQQNGYGNHQNGYGKEPKGYGHEQSYRKENSGYGNGHVSSGHGAPHRRRM